ncbi:unnamed protein product [Ectocarpus sp. CCAP 1310/34]|nr:unnamed protein product [Ectocarpus sp. CCAP 1310/34]
MCKHIINAKVSIQSPCCKRWYECPECHDERENHPQRISAKNVAFACKTCRKIFVKDLSIYGTEDSACPHCETVFVLPAVTPEAKVAQLALSILAAEVSAEVSKF